MTLKAKWESLEKQGMLGVSQRINPFGLAQFIGVDASGDRVFFTLTSVEPKQWSNAGPIQTIKKYLEASNEWYLGLILSDSTYKHEFSYLCDDLVVKVQDIEDESSALDIQKSAYEDWIDFFKRNRELGAEGVRGLFSELTHLKESLELGFNQDDVIQAWVGPFGAPQDFVYSNFRAVEVKSLQPAVHKVRIANEHQLSFDGELFLRIYRLQESPDASQGITLNELVEAIQVQLGAENLREFNLKLAKAGYSVTNTLAESSRFLVGESFNLNANAVGFPKVHSGSLPLGIANVKYEISVSALLPFLVGQDAIL